MKEFWNERYNQSTYVYGKQPNSFYKSQLDLLLPGSILFPAEGEGRNAVYAATKGWQVDAFDISDAGKTKATQLAKEHQVSLNYTVGTFGHLPYKKEQSDVIVLIFAHFDPESRMAYHQHLCDYLKPNGNIHLEGFSKKHLEYSKKNPAVGGPKNPDMLFSQEMILSDFKGFKTLLLQEQEVMLQEGEFHNGMAHTIRFVGLKDT